MPRYFRLPLFQYLNEIADAKLLISHQIEQTQARVVSQGLKEALDIERR